MYPNKLHQRGLIAMQFESGEDEFGISATRKNIWECQEVKRVALVAGKDYFCAIEYDDIAEAEGKDVYAEEEDDDNYKFDFQYEKNEKKGARARDAAAQNSD